MSIKALQDYTYFSRYARYNAEEKRRETWNEAVDRVKEMHLRRYPQVEEEIEWAFDLVRQKRVLGSQRALQFGGIPIEKKHARIYNCTVSFCDRIRFFQESFWLLLCGSGVGFSVQTHHIEKLPDFYNGKYGRKKKRTYLIPDTIEGWADALGILLATYLPHADFSDWAGCTVEFDYSAIRPAGSHLASGVGKAPGPEPLKRSLEVIRELLDRCLADKQKRLRSIDAYDLIMHASDAVLSGGVRRSATICIFSLHDDDMIKAKTGNWLIENPQRGRSNNSALLLRDKTTKEDFMRLIESVKEFGEPGFFWSDSTEQLPNPCVEIGMWPVHWKTKKTGWSFCNLTEINGKKVKCKEDFAIAARAGAIVGTLQAGYTDFDYLGQTTKEIVEREALLGVSITGMMDSPDILFDAKTQREMAKLVVKTNEWMAKKIGIRAAARCTCVKPAGTTSCILGSASGVHPHHAKRYFRRVQGNALEHVLQHFKKVNAHAVEKSVWSANDTDEIVTFCIEVPDGAKTKNNLNAMELLNHVKSTQKNWVTSGKVTKRCTKKWLSHNVSNTINVRPEEWGDVSKFIWDNRKWFAGISILPQSGDLDYPQAPMCNILTPREILQRYGDGALLASGLIVDGIHAFNDLWVACDAVLGMGEPVEKPERPGNGSIRIDDARNWEEDCKIYERKIDWVRRVKQFAERYVDNDAKECCYLLKHAHNWKLWLDLQREYKDVDYTQLIEEQDNTTISETVACGGGSCELI